MAISETKASVNIIRHFNGSGTTKDNIDNEHSKREIGLTSV